MTMARNRPARGRKKGKSLPASLPDLVKALEASKPATNPSAVDQTLLPLLRSPRIPPDEADAARSLVERIAELDPTWRARLALVLESDTENPSDISKRLAGPLVAQARAAIDFPAGPDDSLDGWIRARVPKEWNTAVHLAPLAIALAPLAHEPWWSEVTKTLLRRWSGAPYSVDIPMPGELRKVLTLIAHDPRPARGALALAQAEHASHIQTRKQLVDTAEHRDRLVDTNRNVTSERDRLQRENAGLRERVDSAEAEGKRLRELAERARRDAEQEVAQSSVHGDNRVGRLAFRVTSVLDRETEELKLYLERSEPNVAGALRRLAELERLRDEVRLIRDEADDR